MEAGADERTAMIYSEPLETLDAKFVDGLLLWAGQQGASDIKFDPSDPLWIRIHGDWHAVTTRAVSANEIGYLLDIISRQPNASSLARSGKDNDFTYEVKIPGVVGKSMRFRCNATGCRDGWSAGISMTMRANPDHPPALETYNLSADLIKAMKPRYGLVLVTGPVGSGKSTLLCSVLGDIAVSERRNILTYEAPIEFDLVTIPGRISPVTQTEIPTHLDSFENAPRNSLRRAGDVVLFGESRDRTTMRNMSIEAETGVAVYSTVHTNSVAETISRMVREFSWEERDGMAATLNAAMRCIVHQRLVQRPDGKGRVPIREYLIFDEAVRSRLSGVPMTEMISATQALVEERGHSLMMDAQRKFRDGLIAEREYLMFVDIHGEQKEGQ